MPACNSRAKVPVSTIESHLSKLHIPYETNTAVYSTLLLSRAKLVIAPSDSHQVAELLPYLREEGIPYQACGCCSNTLLDGTDQTPVETALISTKNLSRICEEDGQITAEAGVRVAALSKYAARTAMAGLEFACDIPGTIAGAVATDAWHPIHNYAAGFAQAGIELKGIPKHFNTVLTAAELVRADGEVVVMTPDELEMCNRSSRLAQPTNDLFLIRAHFALKTGNPEEIAKIREVVHLGRCAMRANNREKNPYSVGKTLGYSFVLNHPAYHGVSANTLIATADSLPDEMNIEGMYHSKATSNIICNTGSGTPDGYLRIADMIQEAVMKDHGIEMPLEVRVIT